MNRDDKISWIGILLGFGQIGIGIVLIIIGLLFNYGYVIISQLPILMGIVTLYRICRCPNCGRTLVFRIPTLMKSVGNPLTCKTCGEELEIDKKPKGV